MLFSNKKPVKYSFKTKTDIDMKGNKSHFKTQENDIKTTHRLQ